MDDKLTKKLAEWLAAEPSQRSFDAGNTMLLQLSGNRVRFSMAARQPARFLPVIERELKKYLDFRNRKLQHEEVAEMERKVEGIVADTLSLSLAAAEGPKAGRRPDHDSLPDNIRKLYEDNLEIIVNMRKIHTQLRSLSLADAPCPDSERYPFLKQLIALDKKLHANWKKYDAYQAI